MRRTSEGEATSGVITATGARFPFGVVLLGFERILEEARIETEFRGLLDMLDPLEFDSGDAISI